jgi:hypothetical protein
VKSKKRRLDPNSIRNHDRFSRCKDCLRHSQLQMVRQRIYQIAAGYEDGNDVDLTEDPAHGKQKQVAFNGHFGTNCFHPLFAFTSDGEGLRADAAFADPEVYEYCEDQRVTYCAGFRPMRCSTDSSITI